MEKFTQRKSLRLKNFDYASAGSYFVTICTKQRKPLFGPVGADSISAQMIEKTFTETLRRYKGVDSPIFVVMPNHIHAIITISWADIESAPTISEIVKAFKRYSTLEYIKMVNEGKVPVFDSKIWQRSFYDHIIRNSRDYEEIYRYIYENPLKWELDELFVE